MPALDADVFTNNRLLATLHQDEVRRLGDIFSLREFSIGEVVHDSNRRINEIIFPTDAVFSVVAETHDGDQVEAALIGNDGVAGIAPFLGADSSLLRTLCQIPGTGMVAPTGPLLAKGNGALNTAVRRYALSLMTMAAQGAACNRLHGVEQRAARWLLMVLDRVERNPFPLTQEFFSVMLGTTRPTVSLVASTLRKAGLIEYTRGQITIVDRRGLEEVACECYVLITDDYERATGARLRPGIADTRPTPRLLPDRNEMAGNE